MNVSSERIVRTCATLACACVVGMIAIFFATGVGQDPLQFVHPRAEYAEILLKNPPALRAAVMLDNFFIVFYATLFLALAPQLLERGGMKGMVYASTGLLLFLAFLDMVENFHFLVMLAGAEQGIPPTTGEIGAQVLESTLKFHVGYLGLFLLGFALPLRAPGERALAALSWFVQLPVGILIHVSPRSIAVPLVFVRFTYFVVALVLTARTFGAPRREGGSGAPASSRDTTQGAFG